MSVDSVFSPHLGFSPHVRELASGVDALYLSARTTIPAEVVEKLEAARIEATKASEPIPLRLGDVDVAMAPHAFLRYRYCLEHPYGRIGMTTSSRLPAVRIQPRAEFLHGSGPRGTVAWYQSFLAKLCGPVLMSVSRLDLFADFQGWQLDGDARHEFVCRAKSRHTYEEDGVFNGLTFGTRASGSVSARIYDKTIQSEKTGAGFWKMIWGDSYDPELSVLRVEFELGRNALREFQLTSPEETLDATGALWGYLTADWLTHRTPGPDQTKSRWPVSGEWESIRRARIGEDDWGINRMYLGKRRGSVENLMPGLVGYLASFGAFSEEYSLEDMLPQLEEFVKQRERDTGISLAERIIVKRRKMGLP